MKARGFARRTSVRRPCGIRVCETANFGGQAESWKYNRNRELFLSYLSFANSHTLHDFYFSDVYLISQLPARVRARICESYPRQPRGQRYRSQHARTGPPSGKELR